MVIVHDGDNVTVSPTVWAVSCRGVISLNQEFAHSVKDGGDRSRPLIKLAVDDVVNERQSTRSLREEGLIAVRFHVEAGRGLQLVEYR